MCVIIASISSQAGCCLLAHNPPPLFFVLLLLFDCFVVHLSGQLLAVCLWSCGGLVVIRCLGFCAECKTELPTECTVQVTAWVRVEPFFISPHGLDVRRFLLLNDRTGRLPLDDRTGD